jgi:hypothetical protein
MDYGGEYYNERGSDELKIQIEVEDLLEDFEFRGLRGLRKIKDEDTGKTSWKKNDKVYPLLNEEGIRMIMSRLSARVTKAAKLSWKEDDEIYKDMFHFHMSFVELICKKADEWELDIESAKSILEDALSLVWDVVASSRKGFTAINLKSQYSKQDISRLDKTDNNVTEKRNFLGIPVGKRRDGQ